MKIRSYERRLRWRFRKSETQARDFRFDISDFKAGWRR